MEIIGESLLHGILCGLFCSIFHELWDFIKRKRQEKRDNEIDLL